MHAPCSPFPLLRSRPSPACVERPVKSHPETFCVGVLDSGVAERIRSSGRMNNVYLFSRPCPFIHYRNPPAFTNHPAYPVPLRCWCKVCYQFELHPSQRLRSRHLALITVRPRSAKRLFACVMSAHPPYIFMYPCLGSYRETGWGACSTEFS